METKDLQIYFSTNKICATTFQVCSEKKESIDDG